VSEVIVKCSLGTGFYKVEPPTPTPTALWS